MVRSAVRNVAAIAFLAPVVLLITGTTNAALLTIAGLAMLYQFSYWESETIPYLEAGRAVLLGGLGAASMLAMTELGFVTGIGGALVVALGTIGFVRIMRAVNKELDAVRYGSEEDYHASYCSF